MNYYKTTELWPLEIVIYLDIQFEIFEVTKMFN